MVFTYTSQASRLIDGHRTLALGIRVVSETMSDTHGSFFTDLAFPLTFDTAYVCTDTSMKRDRSSFKILQMNTIQNQCRPPNISGNNDPLSDPLGDLLTGSRQCPQVCTRTRLLRTRRLLQDVFRIWRHTRFEILRDRNSDEQGMSRTSGCG